MPVRSKHIIVLKLPYVSVMVDKYKNKSCFDYEWMSYLVLTQNSTYVFNCSLHSFNMYGEQDVAPL